jgi:hypothetical protein
MPYRPKPVQPDFEKLRTIINTSPSVVKDNPMWQILTGLLDQLKKFQKITVDDIADINNVIEGINNLIININNSLQDATFLTTGDESADFPNSVQLLAGLGIAFDDTVAGQRTISATASGSELPVGSIHSTWINVNAGTMLGYGVWNLFATGIKGPGDDITYTVY